ncbi:hypothetical protein ACTWP5_07265 [Streptomyces sp. 4N509B]|uniref:hypothetical protein n=1 Tax=Streptomyces sp. 4N509B TaxID=3457413 RepID=UPI003FD02242
MTGVVRLVTHVDLDGEAAGPRELSVSARLETVLADGRSVVLLDDRGWSSWLSGDDGDIGAFVSVEEIEETARVVVGPDEPVEGETHERMAAGHWGFLAGVLRGRGVDVDAGELERLRHDVVLSDRLRARIAG